MPTLFEKSYKKSYKSDVDARTFTLTIPYKTFYYSGDMVPSIRVHNDAAAKVVTVSVTLPTDRNDAKDAAQNFYKQLCKMHEESWNTHVYLETVSNARDKLGHFTKLLYGENILDPDKKIVSNHDHYVGANMA